MSKIFTIYFYSLINELNIISKNIYKVSKGKKENGITKLNLHIDDKKYPCTFMNYDDINNFNNGKELILLEDNDGIAINHFKRNNILNENIEVRSTISFKDLKEKHPNLILFDIYRSNISECPFCNSQISFDSVIRSNSMQEYICPHCNKELYADFYID